MPIRIYTRRSFMRWAESTLKAPPRRLSRNWADECNDRTPDKRRMASYVPSRRRQDWSAGAKRSATTLWTARPGLRSYSKRRRHCALPAHSADYCRSHAKAPIRSWPDVQSGSVRCPLLPKTSPGHIGNRESRCSNHSSTHLAANALTRAGLILVAHVRSWKYTEPLKSPRACPGAKASCAGFPVHIFRGTRQGRP